MEVNSEKKDADKLNHSSLILPWKISLLVIMLGILATYFLFYLFNQWLNQPASPMPEPSEYPCEPNYMGGCD